MVIIHCKLTNNLPCTFKSQIFSEHLLSLNHNPEANINMLTSRLITPVFRNVVGRRNMSAIGGPSQVKVPLGVSFRLLIFPVSQSISFPDDMDLAT